MARNDYFMINFGNMPFAAEPSLGTKSPNWRASDTLEYVGQRKFKFVGFV